ncbi:MAG: hypothetical protein WC175_04035 [Candidatus Dojkabacteria bacterium]
MQRKNTLYSFRGWSQERDGYLYGNLIVSSGYRDGIIVDNFVIVDDGIEQGLVIGKSVGQYSGADDRYGEFLYEDDVFMFYGHYYENQPYIIKRNGPEFVCVPYSKWEKKDVEISLSELNKQDIVYIGNVMEGLYERKM